MSPRPSVLKVSPSGDVPIVIMAMSERDDLVLELRVYSLYIAKAWASKLSFIGGK